MGVLDPGSEIYRQQHRSAARASPHPTLQVMGKLGPQQAFLFRKLKIKVCVGSCSSLVPCQPSANRGAGCLLGATPACPSRAAGLAAQLRASWRC